MVLGQILADYLDELFDQNWLEIDIECYLVGLYNWRVNLLFSRGHVLEPGLGFLWLCIKHAFLDRLFQEMLIDIADLAL